MRWEAIIQQTLKRFGVEIHRTLPGSEYMQCAPFTYSTYRPWFESGFEREYGRIAAHTEVTPDRAYVLRQLCRHALHLDGDVAECGVYRGGTAFLLAETIANHSRRPVQLDLFDTFAGMPKSADADASAHREGDFGDTSLTAVQQYLSGYANVAFHPGFIPESFAGLQRQLFSFVHVDVDLYASVRDCCEFFHPRLARGGVMVFDDYGFPHYRDAARKAVDEFFASRLEVPIVLATGQCFVVKL